MKNLELRCDLAAALRWTARLNMHEGIANHFSLATSEDGTSFLMNPYGIHWSKIKASDLVELDANSPAASIGDKVDPTAWAIHSNIRRTVPHARCIMHLHPIYATALASLKDPTMPPVDQNTMRFYNRVAVDDGFDGMGLGDEAVRLATLIGNKSVVMLGQHGILTVGPTVAQAFDDIYYFERAATTYMTALATRQPLNVASHDVAEKTAQQWAKYPNAADKHFSAIRKVLDDEEPEYSS